MRTRVEQRSTATVGFVVLAAALVVACETGTETTPAAPTPTPEPAVTYPDVAGKWTGAMHTTRASGSGDLGADVPACDSLESCADPVTLTADFEQDEGSITGTVSLPVPESTPPKSLEFEVWTGTVSPAGALRLAFEDYEYELFGVTITISMTWEGRIDGSRLTATATMKNTSPEIPGTAEFEGCLGPVSPAACTGLEREP